MASSGPKRALIRSALLAERAARQSSPDSVKIHENAHIKMEGQESSLESIEHSVGCPKYKATSKSKCQLRSPTRPPKVLHPKPWGARDPKEIPCTCFTMRKTLKSAPPSTRSSPVREFRKSVPRRTQSPKSFMVKDSSAYDAGEVMRLFEEFCDQVEKMGVKLSPSELDLMFNKLKSKLSTAATPTAVARMKPKVGTGKRRTSSADSSRQGIDVAALDRRALPEVPQDHRSQSNQSQQQSMSHRTSSSTVRGKLEANNVVLELTGADFPDQTATFTNIFGSMLPPDRFNYMALGSNQFFVPGEVLTPGIPNTTFLTIDSTESYLPVNAADVVVPARMPRSPGRRRRP